MAIIGLGELLVIGFIGLLLIGVPFVIVMFVIYGKKGSANPHDPS
jgi:hypothetical protein